MPQHLTLHLKLSLLPASQMQTDTMPLDCKTIPLKLHRTSSMLHLTLSSSGRAGMRAGTRGILSYLCAAHIREHFTSNRSNDISVTTVTTNRLPTRFPSRFPSLSTVYLGVLSSVQDFWGYLSYINLHFYMKQPSFFCYLS